MVARLKRHESLSTPGAASASGAILEMSKETFGQAPGRSRADEEIRFLVISMEIG
jgi:hypothetical protein